MLKCNQFDSFIQFETSQYYIHKLKKKINISNTIVNQYHTHGLERKFNFEIEILTNFDDNYVIKLLERIINNKYLYEYILKNKTLSIDNTTAHIKKIYDKLINQNITQITILNTQKYKKGDKKMEKEYLNVLDKKSWNLPLTIIRSTNLENLFFRKPNKDFLQNGNIQRIIFQEGIIFTYETTYKEGYVYTTNNCPIFLPKNASRFFAYLPKIKTIELENINTSITEDMSEMFINDKELSILNITNLDYTRIKNISKILKNCNSLKILDIYINDMENLQDSYEFIKGCNADIKINSKTFNRIMECC